MLTTLISEEIYPKIFVYRDIFKNIEKNYSTLKESAENNEDRLFTNWKTWSIFGTYLAPPVLNKPNITLDNAKLLNAKTEMQQNQKDLLVELLENFELVTKDYAEKHGINIDKKSICIDEKENAHQNEWQIAGPSICKYHISEDHTGGMHYHSDYIREQSDRPGHKFVITALAYFNDDYEGGEIDFAIGKKLFKYKPKAGDFLVFPSGHPEILTEDGEVYLHSVHPSKKTNKYFSRMYWQKYEKGTDEWYTKEAEFGKDVWALMQPEVEKTFRDKYPQRSVIENGVRIQ